MNVSKLFLDIGDTRRHDADTRAVCVRAPQFAPTRTSGAHVHRCCLGSDFIKSKGFRFPTRTRRDEIELVSVNLNTFL